MVVRALQSLCLVLLTADTVLASAQADAACESSKTPTNERHGVPLSLLQTKKVTTMTVEEENRSTASKHVSVPAVNKTHKDTSFLSVLEQSHIFGHQARRMREHMNQHGPELPSGSTSTILPILVAVLLVACLVLLWYFTIHQSKSAAAPVANGIVPAGQHWQNAYTRPQQTTEKPFGCC